MAELNFRQITDKLNEEFTGDVRKLIFWYDVNGEFEEDIDSLELKNAKVLHLEKDNQFYVKYFLEREDKTTNYLLYAPFPKPDIRENHLADTIRYSKEFFADRASLLCLDLGISERCKPTIQEYITFFNRKDRTQAFYALELDCYTDRIIEDAMMSVLCKSKTASFEEVARCVLSDGELEENGILAEFAKYGLDKAFWQHCESVFGYSDPDPSLEKLLMSLFVTCVQKTIHSDVPVGWQKFVSYKPGNVLAFMDNLMNSLIYSENFDTLSEQMYRILDVKKVFSSMLPEDLLDCNVFAGVDEILIRWIIGRLEAEDVDARLNGKTIPEICAYRRKKHFGSKYHDDYFVLENAYHLMLPGLYTPVSSVDAVAKNYISKNFRTDRRYRYFYYYFDRLDDHSAFETLRELVENIYTNDYLNNITANWSRAFVEDEGHTHLDNQLDFFSKYMKYKKERVVVIISDAMRFEVGQTLLEKLQADERCEARISAMQSVLPSITSFGMAALLPHEEVTIGNDYKVLCDGMPCADLKQREAILQRAKPNSRCIQFDEIKNSSQARMREILTGQDVVYVYHNQIDARGDKAASENEVFNACEEAVDEILKLIRDINARGNTYHFIITADHGFLYKRNKLHESDKISGISNAGKRYAITDKQLSQEGVVSIPMNLYLPSVGEDRYLLSPVGSDLFKVPGSGLNYVHGGCSPQEMIIPVIEVRTEKSRVSTANATIDLVSLTNKITNLNIKLDFLQREAVSDTVKETTYRVFFMDDDGNRISNENIYHADNKEPEATKRVFTLRFTFKNQSYSKMKKYYLIAVDDKTGLEVLRREVIMDLAFAGDFGLSV
ncbi:MAG: BREX-1 system phosphatase PglZ type A [Oscillospiraceae bacterium]|nr:BREX-1 system phosphatase PglZ type A [Oscillospiraceae bacterium]